MRAALPKRYWNMRPRPYAREEGLESKFEGLVEACKGYAQDVTYGVVVESKEEGVRPAFTASLLKYLMALNEVQGHWRSFPFITGLIRSTKFNHGEWEEFIGLVTTPPHQIIAIEGMSAKIMATMDDEERLRLEDFFQRLFQNGCLVIVSTPDNQDRFEKMLGEDMSTLLSNNLGTWGKLEL